MSGIDFDVALNALSKPQDSKSLLKLLISIRKQVEWPRDESNIIKLRQTGCLRYFSKMLNMNRNIVDVTLSILGNCVMDKGCARDAISVYHILNSLGQLLKHYPNEDSIEGRIFRIIGNVCHHKDQWATIIVDKQPDIVKCGVTVLKEFSNETSEKNISEATLLMAIRAMRLLQNKRTILVLVRDFEVLKVIGGLFIKLCKEWQQSGKKETLLQNIIRLLYDYSKYKLYDSISQMRNTDLGDSLLYLSNVLLLAPKRIVKIVMNFIRICHLKSELPIPEICDKLIDILLKNLKEKDLKKDCVEYIECLCFMLENPANRNNERCGKCIPLLIQIIDGFENPSDKDLELCILIIVTLNPYYNEDNFIQEQLKSNIIEVLLKKLEWIIGDSSKIDKNHKRKKTQTKRVFHFGKFELEPLYGKRRKCICADVPDMYSGLLSPQSPVSSDEERFDRASSPCSSSDSEHPVTPCSSPLPISFPNIDSDSDDYSPVCSEADPSEFASSEINDNDFNDETTINMESPMDEIDELNEIKDSFEKKDDSVVSLKVKLLNEIINFIRSFTSLRPAITQLGSEKLLWALLRSADLFNVPTCVHPVDVIGKILETPDHLIPLMNSNFVESIYDLTITNHKNCETCICSAVYSKMILKKLTTLAESEFGKGDIAHRLLKGSNGLKEQLVLVIPYIIWDKTILGKLMLDCGGLDTLMVLLQDSTMKERTCKVVCAMATKNLKIANPKAVALNLGKRKLFKFENEDSEYNCTNPITFKLDDGSSLKADREFLCEKSDFFSRLLKGHFKENNEDEVSLHNVDSETFKCLLQLLKSVEKTTNVEIRIDLDLLLDVILLCDRYLIVDLCSSLINSVEMFRISRKTVPIIYKWSLESGTNLLRIESIAYALVADLTVNKRLKMFEELFNLGYSTELLEDIHKLLARYLRSSGCCRK